MAGVKLHLATSKIWEYFFENLDRLQDNEDCIAENSDNGMALYLTANTIFPQLVLYYNDHPTIYRLVRSKEECSAYAVYMITRYVVAEQEEKVDTGRKVINLPMTKPADTVNATQEQVEDDYENEQAEEDEEQKILDVIYEREDELSKAMGDLLAIVLCEEDCSAVAEAYGETFINEVVDDFLQYLYDNHVISVYRPVLEYDDDEGCKILKEFPYGWGEEHEEVE